MPDTSAPLAMLVDDNPLILMDACDILGDAGFRCIEAGSGDAAKPLLDVHGDQLVLLFTDVEMPGSTDGFELARYVHERWPEVEIVIASGRVTPKPEDLLPKVTFIAKPFSADVVHDHLREKLPDCKQPIPLKR